MTATAVLERHRDLPTSMLVGRVRAPATSLLRGAGLDRDAARAALEEIPAPT